MNNFIKDDQMEGWEAWRRWLDSLRILQMEIFFKQKRYYGIKCKQVDNAKDFIQYKIKSVEAVITNFTKLKGQA